MEQPAARHGNQEPGHDLWQRSTRRSRVAGANSGDRGLRRYDSHQFRRGELREPHNKWAGGGANFWTAPVLWRFRIFRKAEKRQRTAAVHNSVANASVLT